MEIYLPIIQVKIDILFILFLSFAVGVLSGLFGVGGGFLMTPFLIFLGIPPIYAVPNEVNNILATSVSGSLTHWFKDTLDYKMGLMIIVGGAIGTVLGISTFTFFKEIGKLSLIISLSYMYLLAIIGTLMLLEGASEIDRARKKIILKKKLHTHYWIHGLPFKLRFPKSRLYESIFTPIILGVLVGFVAALMGVGGAFLLVPAMIYLIGMPVKLIPGTSLFVTIFISAIVTVLHAFNYGSIDLILVITLIIGSIIGVQIGQKIGQYLDSSHLKTLFAMLLCAVAIAIAYDTFFSEENKEPIINEVVNVDNLNFFSKFIIKFSDESPLLYGSFAIILAIILGILGAAIRRFLSKHKNKFVLTKKTGN
ncbi:MAG: sulfite exporter TauE/SafE family protein [Pseudomonadota bacterium]|nr:sulfite exporter TauE/SafE family protein [Pseudomonadota bacterium]